MKGFLKTFVIGLAALFLIFSGAMITLGLAAGNDLKRVLRDYVLSEEEKEAIIQAQKRVQEPARIPREQPQSTDDILEALAERVGSTKVNELAESFEAKLNGLRERETYLEQRYTEMRIAEGDLDRKARLLKRERADVERQRQTFDKEREDFALKQVEIAKQVQLIDQVERKQMIAQVKVYEAMKDAAWQNLRQLSPDMIARYLALMDAKKAARIMTLANDDQEYPTISYDIIQSWRTIDLDGISGDQTQRLADLYVYIKADTVADMLIEDNNVTEAAKIILAMQARGGAKKAAAVRIALAEKDALFDNKITLFLDSYDPAGASQ